MSEEAAFLVLFFGVVPATLFGGWIAIILRARAVERRWAAETAIRAADACARNELGVPHSMCSCDSCKSWRRQVFA